MFATACPFELMGDVAIWFDAVEINDAGRA